MVTSSAGVQTDLSKWFTPHVNLFATRLNHKVPLYTSPVPDPNVWDIDALNINWSGLTVYAYPPMALLYRVIQKSGKAAAASLQLAQPGQGCPCFGT